MATHAKLSASSSNRWLNCPPSVRLSEQFQENMSIHAEEGTLAHEIGELKLSRLMNVNMSKNEYTDKLSKLKKHELYQLEMLSHTDTYFDYVNELAMSFGSPPFIAIEKRVDFSQYVPEGFGTSDCIVISGNTLYVIDFKYGKGVPVSAEHNSQAKLYGLGAYHAYRFLYPIQKVVMVILQPRLDSISECRISVDDLVAWGDSIKSVAQMAFAGQGDFKAGGHCKFCLAKAVCRARAEQYSPMLDFERRKPELLSNEEVGELLSKTQGFDKWIKSLQEHALSECLRGNEIEGWKAVEGRGSRSYTDVDATFAHLLANGVAEAVLYDKVPLTVPKLEKALGKKEFITLVGDYVVKSLGKPTLALATDKRAAFNTAQEDFK